MAMVVRILLVDNNPTFLPVTTSMLQIFDYQVVIASNPIEAIHTLRMNLGACYFDLVLCDLRMPTMNAMEFRRIIDEEFHIPVILMSNEHKRSILFRGDLHSGVPFFIDNPPSSEDLINIRQYVISMRNEKQGLNYLKRRLREEDIEVIQEMNSNSKKPKMLWTNDLHNIFLEAVNSIGYHRAVPKKILQYMNVPGLTRENVASHLQKYRTYLRRLCRNDDFDRRLPPSYYEYPYHLQSVSNAFANSANNLPLIHGANSSDLGQFTFGSLATVNGHSGPFQRPYSLNNNLPINNTVHVPNINQESSNPSTYGLNYVGASSNPSNFGLNYVGESSNPSNFGLNYVGESSNPSKFGLNYGNNPNVEGNVVDVAMQYISTPQPQMGGVVNGEGSLANDKMINENLANPKVGNENANSYLDFDDDALERFVNGDTSQEETLINNEQILEYIQVLEQDVTMPKADNYVSAKQVTVENAANDVHLLPNDPQAVLYSGTSSGSNLFRDRGANKADDFSADGLEDIAVVLSSFDGNNESNIQLP